MDALQAALADQFRLTGARPAGDETLRVSAQDNAIVIWFEKPGHHTSCDKHDCQMPK
jgi:hypothetical protein